MMSVLVLGLLVASGCGPGIDVRVAADQSIDIEARNAPLSSVLECLSERAGFKTTIEPGSIARQNVTVSLSHRTPAQAVFGVLDGLRLNYAYTTDPGGSRVVMLMISGRSDTTAAKPAATPVEPTGRPGSRRDPQVAPPDPDAGSAGEPAGERGGNPAPLYPEARPLTPMSLRDARRIHIAAAPSNPSPSTEAARSSPAPGPASRD